MSNLEERSEEPQGLTFWWQLVVFLVVLLAVFSRRPSDIFHAQFYAEDGKRWFAQAYNEHWLRSLAIPDASYLQVLPRMIAGITLLFPFRWAPLLMNLAGGIIQVLPVTVLLSRRCANWGTLPTRMLMAVVYIANPNSSEVHVNLTNAQWHFALLQVLLAFSLPPRTWLGRVSDCSIFLLGVVSGPFGIVLLPLVLVYWYLRRQQWSLAVAACLFAGVIVQVHSILIGTRMPPMPLGASVGMLMRLIGGNVIINSMVGQSTMGHLPMPLIIPSFIFGLIVIGAAVWWGPIGIKLFALYAAVWLAGAFKSPMIAGPRPLWEALLDDNGGRYYFFPTVVFLWCAVYCVMKVPIKVIRVAGYVSLLLLVFGTIRKWEYYPFPNRNFPLYAEKLKEARPGEHVLIPIFPDWKMELIKH